MSVQYKESIYGWIPQEQREEEKPMRYRSKYNPREKPTASTLLTHGSTQLPGANLGDSFHPYPDPVFATTKVPRRHETSLVGIRSNKNYIITNAVTNILAKPPAPAPVTDYTAKEDYGKVPSYLTRVREEIDEENRLIERMMAPEPTLEELGLQRHMDAVEREELILALKKKWDELNHKYQSRSHSTIVDTLGSLSRKEGLEKELSRIEKDIQLLTSKRPIVITDLDK